MARSKRVSVKIECTERIIPEIRRFQLAVQAENPGTENAGADLYGYFSVSGNRSDRSSDPDILPVPDHLRTGSPLRCGIRGSVTEHMDHHGTR